MSEVMVSIPALAPPIDIQRLAVSNLAYAYACGWHAVIHEEDTRKAWWDLADAQADYWMVLKLIRDLDPAHKEPQ